MLENCTFIRPEMILKSVTINGRLEGLLLKMTVTQSYQNSSPNNLEVIYTFPLGFEVVLTEFKAKIKDKTYYGAVLDTTAAKANFEEAIDEGDT
ncbi:MAG: hypothetical protein LBD41_04360, partial [Clostridiales Family XIII bacterium]|nr:hypothetical protein [Clostridiales Family XIII bacterium]